MSTYDEAALATFEDADDQIAVYEGEDLVVRAINRAARAGLGRGDLIGTPAGEVFGDWGARQVLDVLREVYASGRRSTKHEWRLQWPDDHGRNSERVVNFQVDPWLEDDGSIRGVIARGRDVSRQVRARQLFPTRQHSALEMVRTIQDVLLPEDLPVLPGLDLDGSYLLAAEHAAAGGDWYDALVRPSGRVVLVAGDVTGHGVVASAVMGQLRAVLHERLMGDEPLADAVTTVDRYADLRPASQAATLVAVEIDIADGRLSYVTAGHPSPLVVGPDGAARFLEPSGAGPLGTGGTFPVATARLEEGQMVLLYTDGAVERPQRTPQQGTDELAAIVSRAVLGRGLPGSPPARATERVCRAGLELLARRTGHSDDITLLAAQRVAAPAPLRIEMPADAAAVSLCRLEIASWLDGVEARSLDAVALQHAVGEVVDNVVRHAYRDALAGAVDRAAVSVDLALLPSGEVEVVVADHGHWREPAGEGGGRGLAMVRGFMDGLSIDTGADGTTVTVRHRLTRPATLSAAGPSQEVHGRATMEVELVAGGVTLHGAVDSRSADELRVTLDRATHGRTTGVTIDLSDVTHLGSPGVQVLCDLVRDDPDVDLVAEAGSVADHVLDLVCLGHRAPS